MSPVANINHTIAETARTILVVGGGSDLHIELRKQNPGVRTVALARLSVRQWVHGMADNEEVVLLSDDVNNESWLDAGRYLARRWNVIAVASFAEIDQDKAALIAEDLGLDCYAIATVRAAQDKNAMRNILAAAGVEELPHRQVNSAAELLDYLQEVGPPLIVKPTQGRASIGIAVVRSEEDVNEAFARTSSATSSRMVPSPPLAERYVDGPEYSIEAISDRRHHYVLGITEKTKTESTKVEIGHVVPASLSTRRSAELLRHVRCALDALGVRSGVTHTEAILSKDGPFIVETHLRLGGDEIPLLIEMATGLNQGILHVWQIAGADLDSLQELRPYRERPVYHHGAAIRYFAPNLHGRLIRIDGLDEARHIKGVVEVKKLVDDGTALNGVQSSYDRLVSVRAEGANAAEASASAASAVAVLSAVVSS